MVRENSIRFYRKLRGWSLAEYSRLTNMSINTIQKLERFEIEPKLSKAIELAEQFGMPVEELFFLKGQNPPKRIIDGVE